MTYLFLASLESIILATYARHWRPCLLIYGRYLIWFLGEVDDILIFSLSKEYHIGHLRQPLEVPHTNQLKMQLKRCPLKIDSINLLGFVVYKHGICVDSASIFAIVDWLVNTTYQYLEFSWSGSLLP